MSARLKSVFVFTSLIILIFTGLSFLFYSDFFTDEINLVIDLILCSLSIAFLIFQFINWISKNLSNRDKSDSHHIDVEKLQETIVKEISKEQKIAEQQQLKKTASELVANGLYYISIGNIDESIICYNKAQDLDPTYDLSLLKKRIDEENQRRSRKQEFIQAVSTISENAKIPTNLPEKRDNLSITITHRNLLSTGWNIYVNSFRQIFGILIIWSSFSLFLSIWYFLSMNNEGAMIFYYIFIFFFLILIIPPITGGFCKLYLRLVRKQSIDSIDFFSGFSQDNRVYPTYFLLFIIYLGGCLLCIIPGIVWVIKYSLCLFAVMDKSLTAREAIKYSGRITKGYKYELFIVFIFFVLFHMLISLPQTLFFMMNAPNQININDLNPFFILLTFLGILINSLVIYPWMGFVSATAYDNLSKNFDTPIIHSSDKLPSEAISTGIIKKRSNLAIASMILGISGILTLCVLIGFPLGIAALITGSIARSKIRESNGNLMGDGFAMTGFVLGSICLALFLIMAFIYFLGDSQFVYTLF